ncbi:MAG: hypothetical protein JJT77_12885, partial [Crocinitomicaceae bacterium]|nr:hypothetical protein [Crocinitomicaceae bacterium]
DCDTAPYEHFSNVVFHKMTFEEYVQNARQKASIDFQPANAYKLCDLRPLYPVIHFDDIKNSDFYGWTDMDILYGDIRSFYTEEILSNYDVISSQEVRVSGHMALFRNTPKYRNLYLKIYDWRNKLAYPHFVGIDEHGVTNALTMTFWDKLNEKMGWNINNFFTRWIKNRKVRKFYMVEQYTTPCIPIPWFDGSKNSDQPDTWYYKDGVVTNERDGNRNFIYLHLMNFKSSTYRHDGSKAPWEGKDNLFRANVEDMKSGIIIDNNGIQAMK